MTKGRGKVKTYTKAKARIALSKALGRAYQDVATGKSEARFGSVGWELLVEEYFLRALDEPVL